MERLFSTALPLWFKCMRAQLCVAGWAGGGEGSQDLFLRSRSACPPIVVTTRVRVRTVATYSRVLVLVCRLPWFRRPADYSTEAHAGVLVVRCGISPNHAGRIMHTITDVNAL